MFSVRVVTADYYMSSPLPGLDPCQSSFREAPVKKVPVVRVFGATPSGKDGRPLAPGTAEAKGALLALGTLPAFCPFFSGAALIFLRGGRVDQDSPTSPISLSLPLRFPPRDVGALQREPPLPAPAAAAAVEQTRRFPGPPPGYRGERNGSPFARLSVVPGG